MKKMVSVLLCAGMILALAACGNSSSQNAGSKETTAAETTAAETTAAEATTAAAKEETTMAEEGTTAAAEATDGALVVAAADAALTGQAPDAEGNAADTVYDKAGKFIAHFGTDSTITFTMPETVEGQYDMYLNMGKSDIPRGSTMVTLSVNGSPAYAVCTDIGTCAEDKSDINDMGLFLMSSGVSLKAGDTVVFTGMAAHESRISADNDKMTSRMPVIGDLVLYPAGTEVAVGYDGGQVPTVAEADASDPLSGLNIAWLGSSVTYGAAAKGYSMANTIEKNHPATKSYKYAISGTTLVDTNAGSYVARMKQIDPSLKFDLFVVQLSTNDAQASFPFGEVTDATDLESFDVQTIDGAMEYIIAYVKETWGCPVAFYTGSYFYPELEQFHGDDVAAFCENYNTMVGELAKIQEKWNIGVIDLWNDEEIRSVVGTDAYAEYMGDPVHPFQKGYDEWWGPKMEAYLAEFITSNK